MKVKKVCTVFCVYEVIFFNEWIQFDIFGIVGNYISKKIQIFLKGNEEITFYARFYWIWLKVSSDLLPHFSYFFVYTAKAKKTFTHYI